MFQSLFGARKKSSLIDAGFETISKMLLRASEMYDLATASLLDNAPLDADLDALDDEIDAGERAVRRSILEHLSVDPRHDLVASLILVSIVQDAERIGDFARGLGDVGELARHPREGVFADELKALAMRVRPSFERCASSFRNDEPKAARQVIEEHVKVKGELAAYVRRVANSDLPVDLAVVYAGSARIYARVSAHLSNIASSVVQPYDRIRHGDEDV